MALECMVGVRLSAKRAGSPAVKNLVYRSVPGLDHSQRPVAAVLRDSGPPLYPSVHHVVDFPEHRINETGEVFIGRVIREHFRNTGLRVGSRIQQQRWHSLTQWCSSETYCREVAAHP